VAVRGFEGLKAALDSRRMEMYDEDD